MATVKYTPEQVDYLVNNYKSGASVKDLAAHLSVPERSVIAKLASLGVYQKKTYVSKTGEPPVKKERYIEQLSEALDTDIMLLESLEKVNKRVLVLLLKKLAER